MVKMANAINLVKNKNKKNILYITKYTNIIPDKERFYFCVRKRPHPHGHFFILIYFRCPRGRGRTQK